MIQNKYELGFKFKYGFSLVEIEVIVYTKDGIRYGGKCKDGSRFAADEEEIDTHFGVCATCERIKGREWEGYYCPVHVGVSLKTGEL